MNDIVEDLRHPTLRGRAFTIAAKAAAEIDRLRAALAAAYEQIIGWQKFDNQLREKVIALEAELAAMTKRAETAEDTVGCQTDLERDFAAVHAEIVPLRKRLAGLEALGKRMLLAADSNGLGSMPLFEEARVTFQGYFGV